MRAHWLWRHVTYPGGHIPLEDMDTRDNRESESIRAGNANRLSEDDAPNGSSPYAAGKGRAIHDPTANDAVTSANEA